MLVDTIFLKKIYINQQRFKKHPHQLLESTSLRRFYILSLPKSPTIQKSHKMSSLVLGDNCSFSIAHIEVNQSKLNLLLDDNSDRNLNSNIMLVNDQLSDLLIFNFSWVIQSWLALPSSFYWADNCSSLVGQSYLSRHSWRVQHEIFLYPYKINC